MPEFLARLRQRKLVQWAVAYVAFAFALLQGIDIVAQRFAWPDAIERALILASCVGFFVTLVLAWYHGEKGAQRAPGTELAILALLLAIGGGLLWRFGKSPTPGAEAAVAVPTLPVATQPEAAIPAKSIAVLPFESLSADKSNEYFVSGMQDMILTSLARLDGLKVISRTSTEHYASRPEKLRQVGAELGVATVLEGSVQRVGDRVLINLQLIDARTDAHLWAESYERQIADVFSVEREVAGAVATALRAKLMPEQIADMGRAPTTNPAAYDLYLRGEYETRQFYASDNDADIRDAIVHYTQAVAADPDFALAHARLARAELLRYWESNGTVPDPSLATAARDAAARAIELAPDLAEARLAMADIEYRLDLDYVGALKLYDAVLAQLPQSVDALSGKAQALRRLGRIDEAIAAFTAAIAVDPRDSAPLTDRGITRFLAGDLTAAEADLRHSLGLNPADSYAATYLASLLLFRDGNAGTSLDTGRSQSVFAVITRVQSLACQRRFDAALAVLDSLGPIGDDNEAYVVTRAQILAYMGKLEEARQRLSPKMPRYRKELAALPVNSGDGQNARFYVATAEALLGNEKEAVQLAQQGLDLLPLEKDRVGGSVSLGEAARVYAMLGRADLVVSILSRVRALDGTDTQTSAAILRLDPVWDKVRNDPRFESEIDRFAAKQARLAERGGAIPGS